MKKTSMWRHFQAHIFLEPNEYLFKGGFVKARMCVASQLFVKDVVDDMDTLGCCNAASCS